MASITHLFYCFFLNSIFLQLQKQGDRHEQHIRASSKFVMTNENDVTCLWHFSNLDLLWTDLRLTGTRLSRVNVGGLL